jgi:very-short-patch-repair endonuclease
MRRVKKLMTERARSLRKNATPAERTLWRLLSRYRPAFTRQLSVDDLYIVDLANREAKLVIEVDGSKHNDQIAYDTQRTAYLESQGWRVVRLWNSDVLQNPQGAAEFVLLQTAECLGGTHPHPLPSREGRARKPRY